MNKIAQLLLLLVLWFNPLQAEKYALVIAIGDYPDGGGWPDISSQNDIIHVTGSLTALGFTNNNIVILKDSEATKSRILEELEKLRAKISKGDIVFIHFSGHGQQIVDDNNDEIDQLDEAIVPYDSPIDYKANVYEGKNLIRDDELGEITAKIRVQSGKDGQVILVLDSCHSGSGTRGIGKSRGTTKLMAPKDFKVSKVKENNIGIARVETDDMAPMASFFGASSRELNYEALDDQAKPVGSLSYSLYSILANMKRSYSFDELFDRVKKKMKTIAPRQNPQYEGPSNTILFGDEIKNRELLISIKKVVDPKTLKIEAGTLFEIFKGTTVDIISMNDGRVIGSGLVTKAGLSESNVKLESNLEYEEDDLLKVKIKERTLPSIFCTMQNDIPESSVWSALAKELSTIAVVQKVEVNPELLLTQCEEGNSLQILSKDGSILFEQEFSSARKEMQLYKMKKVVSGYAQGKFLKSFETPNTRYSFEIELVKVDPETEEEISTLDFEDSSELKIGTNVKIRVKNTGKKSGYFSVLDIQPDNGLNLLIPAVEIGYTADEYFLESNESYTTDYVIEIGEPVGFETLKLICSKEPLDLASLIQNNGTSTRGFDSLNSFEQALSQSFDATGTRGTKIKKRATEEVGVFTLNFEIAK